VVGAVTPRTGNGASIITFDNTPSPGGIFTVIPKTAAGGLPWRSGHLSVSIFLSQVILSQELGKQRTCYVNRYQIRMQRAVTTLSLYGSGDHQWIQLGICDGKKTARWITHLQYAKPYFQFWEVNMGTILPEGTTVELHPQMLRLIWIRIFQQDEKPTTGEIEKLSTFTIPKRRLQKHWRFHGRK
jgi:hypothetical protein